VRIAVILGGTDEVQGHVQAAVEAEQDGFDGIWFAQILGPDVLSAIALAGLSARVVP
jgi:alkanesulfonate monooxygenase SsuD/methylene tetrahydromethanopterin reductase-like flavin-dependent oxidoreductase (luciferase family)